MQGTIVSLNVAMPSESLVYRGKPVLSGMVKQPLSEPTMLHELGFEGDGVADTKHHGGRDKAVCVYAAEHYAYWSSEWNRELPHAAFGENITTSGMLEHEIHVGDTFKLGEAVVQISQPRQPCFKVAARYDMKEVPVWMQDTGYTGYYVRVLQPGLVRPDDKLERISVDPNGVTVQYANEVMHHKRDGEDGVRKMLAVKALSRSWRATFTKRLGGEVTDTSARISGS
ncbi:MOSC domain-containing protein [Paenibacillus sp. 481]|uniref:MOSC domain-containing protein n=1 Tax=Paenibacillus sp. 481 TaxID=2835869 RepID=UPI001E465B62|nr:MOSC domain-containing protein [Paenibacillus sp. 481]UHA72124.1 MOSC domain-containing protein [Paenibacillus sp. 481]